MVSMTGAQIKATQLLLLGSNRFFEDSKVSQSAWLRGAAQSALIDRVTDAFILKRTAERLLPASGWTVPRQTILQRHGSLAQVLDA